MASTHQHMLGSRGNVRRVVHYLSEYKILYACGNIAIIYDINNKKQQFITGMKGITVISPSPCKRMIALTEVGNVGSVNIYDSSTRRHKKSLRYVADHFHRMKI